MIVCWDTSAVVKLLRDEDGHDLAVRLWQSDGPAVAATLVIAELAAALARAHRDGGLTPSAYDLAMRSSARLVEEIDLLALNEHRAMEAARLAHRFGLRSADAVHLSTAVDVADRGAEVVLASWDGRLTAAAVDAGVSVAPAVR